MTEIKYVCFDVGGVAAESGKQAKLAKAQERWGRDFNNDDFRLMRKPDLDDGVDYWRSYQNGEVETDEYLSAAVRAVGLEDTFEEKEHFAECLRAMTGQPYNPILDLVDRLLENNYHISVLTNNNQLMFSSPSSQSIVEKASVTVSSHEVGVSKPELRIYEILLEGLGNPNPASVLFIDDKIRNTKAAEEVGLSVYTFLSKTLPLDEAYNNLLNFLRTAGIDYGCRDDI